MGWTAISTIKSAHNIVVFIIAEIISNPVWYSNLTSGGITNYTGTFLKDNMFTFVVGDKGTIKSKTNRPLSK